MIFLWNFYLYMVCSRIGHGGCEANEGHNKTECFKLAEFDFLLFKEIKGGARCRVDNELVAITSINSLINLWLSVLASLGILLVQLAELV